MSSSIWILGCVLITQYPSQGGGQSYGSWQPTVGQQQGNRYQLGVRVNNLEYGVLVQQVVPGSPANKVGLQADDIIITVDGTQVGYVKGQLHDIADECNIHASPQGTVRLLVRKATGPLVNVTVNLTGQTNNPRVNPDDPGAGAGWNDPHFTGHGGIDFQDNGFVSGVVNTWGSSRISGRLLYPTGNTLPLSATVKVKLTEKPAWNAPPVTIAETVIPNAGRLPLPYELPFRDSDLQAGGAYTLEASVIDGKQRLYRTAQPFPIQDPRAGAPVDLTLVSLQSNPNSSNSDQILRWYRQYFGREPDAAGVQYWIGLADAGTPLPEIRATFLSGSEFFDRSWGNTQRWVSELFVQVLNRKPNPQEQAQWLARLQVLRNNRMELVREFLKATGQWQ